MPNHYVKSANQEPRISGLHKAASTLIGTALFSAVILFLSSLLGIPAQTHGYLSSLPLALAAAGYALLQTALRPTRGALLKRLILAATFAAWAVDQVLTPGPVATFIGDLVIAAYVLDLYWIAQEQLSPGPSSGR